MEIAKQIVDFKEVPVRVRAVTLFVLGLVPVNCLLTFGADAVPSLGVLEASAFEFVVTVMLLSLLLFILKGNALRIAAYILTLALTFLWIVELYVNYWGYYSHTISVSIWISLLTVAYIVRVDLIYRLKDKVLDYLHIQLRLDSIVVIVSIAFYMYSYTIQHRASVVPKQIAVVCIACIVLWAFALWHLENRVAERRKVINMSLAGMPLVVMSAAVVAIPAFSLLNEVNVLLGPINVPELPPLHPKHKLPAGLLHDNHSAGEAFTHTFLVLLFMCVAAGLILYFIISRKREMKSSQRDSLSPGMMNTTQRQKLSHRNRSFLQTNHPIRKQVQRWLRRLDKRGAKITQPRTIRVMATETGNNEINLILGTYEQVRYDPDEVST